MVLNFDNHIQFSVFLTKPLFNLKIFIYVNIISHINISSKKIVFIIIQIQILCLTTQAHIGHITVVFLTKKKERKKK